MLENLSLVIKLLLPTAGLWQEGNPTIASTSQFPFFIHGWSHESFFITKTVTAFSSITHAMVMVSLYVGNLSYDLHFGWCSYILPDSSQALLLIHQSANLLEFLLSILCVLTHCWWRPLRIWHSDISASSNDKLLMVVDEMRLSKCHKVSLSWYQYPCHISS